MVTKLSSTLAKNVIKLSNSRGQVVHLLGTAHKSERSCTEVKELIHKINPAAVFVELCEGRRKVMEPNFTKDTIKVSIRDKWTGAFTGDLKEGNDFATASQTAKKLGIPLILGDRSAEISLKRMWMGLTLRQKAELLWYVFIPQETSTPFVDADQLVDNKDLLSEEIRLLGKQVPWVIECMVNERDLFMVLRLEMLLKELKSSPKKKVDVVAVVGAGHLEGMQRIWNARQTPPLPTELETQKLFQQILAYPGMEGVNYTKKDLRAYAASVTGRK